MDLLTLAALHQPQPHFYGPVAPAITAENHGKWWYDTSEAYAPLRLKRLGWVANLEGTDSISIPSNNNAPFTTCNISFLFRFDAPLAGYPSVFQVSGSDKVGVQLYINPSNGLQATLWDGVSTRYNTPTKILQAGRWYNVSVSADKNNPTQLAMLVNGELIPYYGSVSSSWTQTTVTTNTGGQAPNKFTIARAVFYRNQLQGPELNPDKFGSVGTLVMGNTWSANDSSPANMWLRSWVPDQPYA